MPTDLLTQTHNPSVHRSTDPFDGATTTTLGSNEIQPNPPIGVGCLGALVTMFANAYVKKKQSDCMLAELLKDIRTGRYAKPIASIRATYQRVRFETGDVKQAKKAIDSAKPHLPSFCMSGTAADRKTPLVHSGFLQIDLDNLGVSLPAVREKVRNDPHVAFGFVSPSGDGLKLGLRINRDRHLESFAEAEGYFRDRYGLPIDKAVKDLLRLCFVSHDPELWKTPYPVILNVESIRPKKKSLSEFRLHSASCITASLHTCTSTPLHNTATSQSPDGMIYANIIAKKRSQEALEAKHPGLPKLYADIIDTRFHALPHERNAFITEAVPFLYRATAPQVGLDLVGHFYDCNRAIFNDSRDQHMREAKAMLDSVAISYSDSLSAGEQEIYDALTEHEQNAFRICRDLAMRPKPEREPMTFFISFDQLGTRLGIFSMQAQRIMRQLKGYGLLKQLTKGAKRQKGVRGKAGTYQWLLVNPPPVANAEPDEVIL